MASTYVIAANALEAICASTFPAVPVSHDNLHPALGVAGPRIGIAPIREPMNTRNKLVRESWIEIRYLDQWSKQVDPAQAVDPREIATKADLLLNAIRTTDVTVSGDMWYFNVEGIEYPEDPTGNKSRFYMTVRAWGNNTSLVETTG